MTNRYRNPHSKAAHDVLPFLSGTGLFAHQRYCAVCFAPVFAFFIRLQLGINERLHVHIVGASHTSPPSLVFVYSALSIGISISFVYLGCVGFCSHGLRGLDG